jgi:hypothetical protein
MKAGPAGAHTGLVKLGFEPVKAEGRYRYYYMQIK